MPAQVSRLQFNKARTPPHYLPTPKDRQNTRTGALLLTALDCWFPSERLSSSTITTLRLLRIRAVAGQVASLAAVVARAVTATGALDALLRAVAGQVADLTAVEARTGRTGLALLLLLASLGAVTGNVPSLAAVVAGAITTATLLEATLLRRVRAVAGNVAGLAALEAVARGRTALLLRGNTTLRAVTGEVARLAALVASTTLRTLLHFQLFGYEATHESRLFRLDDALPPCTLR